MSNDTPSSDNPSTVSVWNDETAQNGMTLDRSTIETLIQQFATATPSVNVNLTGQHFVIYDPEVTQNQLAPAHSLTFDFNDSSHISIVGTSPELIELHG